MYESLGAKVFGCVHECVCVRLFVGLGRRVLHLCVAYVCVCACVCVCVCVYVCACTLMYARLQWYLTRFVLLRQGTAILSLSFSTRSR